VEVENAILDLFILAVCVEVVEEGLEELGNAVLDNLFLENLANDELGNELDVAQDFLLCLPEEVVFSFLVLEDGEFFHPFIEGMLNLANQKVLEGILFLLVSCFELEA
jgi:hypothetical protein